MIDSNNIKQEEWMSKEIERNVRKERLIPLTRWNDYHDFPTVSALRHFVFFEEQNGFHKVIKRILKRIYICEKSFFEWVEEQNKRN